jgi:hypothetical protein
MIFLKRFKHYTKCFVYLTEKLADDFVILDKNTSINSMSHGYKVHTFGYNGRNIIISYRIYEHMSAYINITTDGEVQYIKFAKVFRTERPPFVLFTFSDRDNVCMIYKDGVKNNIKLSFCIVTKDTTQTIKYTFDGPMYIKI